MSLTGWPLRWLVGSAAVLALAAVVYLWPRLSRTRLSTVAARAGALVMVNVLLVTTLALQVNAHYYFFADWTDLHGALTGHLSKTSLHRGGNALRASTQAVVGRRAAGPRRTLPTAPPGDLVSYQVPGPLSGVTASVVVALPPGYRLAANRQRRYPVLEAFHGYPGSPQQWFKTMGLTQALATAVGRHQLQAPLVVSPQLEVPGGIDTECVDGNAGYPQMETWLAEDVPNWVAQHFRVATFRSSWATIGISAGAWCAAMIGMLHPAQFGAAIVLGGYFRPDFGPAYPPYPPRSRLAQRYDLVALATQRPPPLAMWLETSHSDPVSYATSSMLLSHAHAPLAISAVVLQHAGHHVGLWIELLPECLSWLARSVPGFSPTG